MPTKRSLVIFSILTTTIIVAILIVSVFVFLYKSMDEIGNHHPEESFRSYFDANLDTVSDLRGSGRSFMGHDFYIRFVSETQITPKHPEQAIPIDNAKPRKFFLGVFPEDKDLLNSHDLSCEFDAGERDAPNSDGQWFCFSNSHKTYWFRNWWIS